MPLTPSPAAGPRRRAMLAGTLSTLGPLGALAALGTTAGCSGESNSSDAAQTTDAEHRLRREAARQCRTLLDRYEATAAAHTALADRLRPLRAATEKHAEALAGKTGSGHGGSTASENDGKKGKKGSPAVPGSEKAALAALGEAERRAAEERTAALLKAPPELARLLASLAAAAAAHAYLLGADGQDSEGTS